MLQVIQKTLTLEEFLQLSETKPASEYIDGQIIQKPIPQGKHSIVQSELVPAINIVVKQKKIGFSLLFFGCNSLSFFETC